MQALYALRQAEQSNQQLAVDFIQETFQPDLNSMKPQNLPQLEVFRNQATQLFEEALKNNQLIQESDIPPQVRKAAVDALTYYRNRTAKDQQQTFQRATEEVRTLDDSYIRLLTLLTQLAHVARIDRERTHQDPDAPQLATDSGLDQNRVIRALSEFRPLEVEAQRRGISWSDELPLVRKIFNDVLKHDDAYQAYCENYQHTDEEEQALVQHILRNVLLKQDPARHYFEENVLNWHENSEVVRGMAIKTLKSAQSEEGLRLVPLTDDWEEDLLFMETLYKKSLENDAEYERLLADQLTNWDVERVALTDKIILKLALCELLNFPNIPVKVTINEYIDLAKTYSTPKSGKFVNGILDSLSEKLKTSGQLRKSGRGLLDNR